MKRQTAQEIEADALNWVMALDRSNDARSQRRLDAWLAGDTRRQGAFLKAQAMWATMGEAASGAEVTPLFPATTQRKARRGIDRRTAMIGGGLAASLAAAIGFTLRPQVYRTEKGEQRAMPLEDGSTIRINTDSALSVALTRERRTIRLKDGEAWFKVAHDKARPFTVEAGGVAVQATGTAFAVRRAQNGVDVLVTEGSVDVWSLEAPGRKVALKAGQSLFVATAAPAPDKARILDDAGEVRRKLAWRDGRIELDGETLGFAAAEFNRYNRLQLRVTGDALAGERLYGVFSVDDPEAFARAAQVSLRAFVQRPSPDEIAISR
ncbi:FecR domain-containing protein [Caulobacter sp.]|uniref:FecR domain-containing protein n=1 Tax=Caulobacter sp. TaxID=78 RepID=UPI0016074961